MYKERTEDGRIYRRNQRHLRFSREPFHPDHENSELGQLPQPPQCNDDPVPAVVGSEPTPATPTSELPNMPVSTPVQLLTQPVSARPMKTHSGRVIVTPMRYRDV